MKKFGCQTELWRILLKGVNYIIRKCLQERERELLYEMLIDL